MPFPPPMRRKRRKRRRVTDQTAAMPDHFRHRPRVLELPAGDPADDVTKSYSPVQPRWPAGHSQGGKWRPAGVGIPDGRPQIERPTLFDLLDNDPPDSVTKRPALLDPPATNTPEPSAALHSTGVQHPDAGPLSDAADLLNKLAAAVGDTDLGGLPAVGDVARVVDHANSTATEWADRYRDEAIPRPALLGPSPDITKFDPRQPRAPKGAASGGQWVAGSAVSGGKGPMRGGGGGGGGSAASPGPLLQRQIDRLEGWKPGDSHVINRKGAVSPDASALNYIVHNSPDDDYNQAEDFKSVARTIQRAKPVTSPMSRNEGEQVVASSYDLQDDSWWNAFSEKPPFSGLPKLGDRASGRAHIDGQDKTWTGRVVGYDKYSATGNAGVYIETDYKDAGGWRRTVLVSAEREGVDGDDD